MKLFASISSAAQQRIKALDPIFLHAREHINRLNIRLSKGTKEHKFALVMAEIVLTLLLTGAVFYIHKSLTTDTYHVAYIGRCQNPQFQRIHELALNKYFKELNAGLDGVRFKLDYKCNGGDSDASRRIYQEIASKPEYVLVIDNTWGKDLGQAKQTIVDEKIPVISINADRWDVDYEYNVVFIGPDDYVPGKVANFSANILKNKEVIFITENDYRATKQFTQEFELRNTKVIQIDLTSSQISPAEEGSLMTRLEAAISELRQRQTTPTVILNTHSNWGDVIINYIDTRHDGITLLGGPYIVTKTDFTKFGLANRRNKAIIFTNPDDAITDKVYNDRQSFRAEDNVSRFTNSDQLFVKRCLDAVSLIGEVLNDGQTEKSTISRQDFTEFFQRKLVGKNLASKYDFYFFNENLLLSDERTFEEFSQGESFSYPEQLKSQSQVTPNADIPIVNIHFGLEIKSISNIDLEKNLFHAEFFYRLKYDRKYSDIESHVYFPNAKPPLSVREIPIDDNPADPMTNRIFEVSGEFRMDPEVSKFPLDTQELKIPVEISKPDHKVGISYDYRSIKDSKKQADFSLDEWYKEDFYVTVDNFTSAPFLGSASLANKEPQRVKSLNVHIRIRRDSRGPLVTIFLPLVMIGVAAIALLFLDNSFTHVGDVCVGIFLCFVTYSIAFAQNTPRSHVLTTADLLFYSTFGTVLLVFLKIIFFNSNMACQSVRNWESQRATKIGATALISYLLLVAVIVIYGLT